MKICHKCRQEKPEEAFSRDSHKKDKLRYHCRECVSIRDTARRRATPEKFYQRAKDWAIRNSAQRALHNRRSRYKKKFGLSLGEVEALIVQQEGKCAACGDPFSGKPHDLCVDHCHCTNKVRGILCLGCNVGLGQFKDSPERLFAAAAYLQKHSG